MLDLKYVWNSGENSVQMLPDLALPQFNVVGAQTEAGGGVSELRELL